MRDKRHGETQLNPVQPPATVPSFEGASAVSAVGLVAMPLTSAHAQDATTSKAEIQPGEIVVTASRRSESVAKLPFNISAYGADILAKGNITSVTALTPASAQLHDPKRRRARSCSLDSDHSRHQRLATDKPCCPLFPEPGGLLPR